MTLASWDCDLIDSLARSPWLGEVHEFFVELVNRGQDLFLEYWPIVWLLAIVVGLWCLKGCARRQVH